MRRNLYQKSLWRDISPPKSGPPWGGGFWKNINTKYCNLQCFMHLKGLKCWWNARFFIFSSWQTLTKHAQALKKNKQKNAWSPNMHRHQKKQKTKHDLHKNSTGIKKTKKQKHVIYRPPTLSRCSEFCFFFCFFDACAGFVHLVVWFFCFFDACAGFVTLTFTKHAKASKKQSFCQALISSTAVTINFT